MGSWKDARNLFKFLKSKLSELKHFKKDDKQGEVISHILKHLIEITANQIKHDDFHLFRANELEKTLENATEDDKIKIQKKIDKHKGQISLVGKWAPRPKVSRAHSEFGKYVAWAVCDKAFPKHLSHYSSSLTTQLPNSSSLKTEDLTAIRKARIFAEM